MFVVVYFHTIFESSKEALTFPEIKSPAINRTRTQPVWLEQSTLCVTGIESWLFRWPVRTIETRHHDKSDGTPSRERPQTLPRLSR